MSKAESLIFIGMDVHQDSVTLAVLEAFEGSVQAGDGFWSVHAPKMRSRPANREQILLAMDLEDGHSAFSQEAQPRDLSLQFPIRCFSADANDSASSRWS